MAPVNMAASPAMGAAMLLEARLLFTAMVQATAAGVAGSAQPGSTPSARAATTVS